MTQGTQRPARPEHSKSAAMAEPRLPDDSPGKEKVLAWDDSYPATAIATPVFIPEATFNKLIKEVNVRRPTPPPLMRELVELLSTLLPQEARLDVTLIRDTKQPNVDNEMYFPQWLKAWSDPVQVHKNGSLTTSVFAEVNDTWLVPSKLALGPASQAMAAHGLHKWTMAWKANDDTEHAHFSTTFSGGYVLLVPYACPEKTNHYGKRVVEPRSAANVPKWAAATYVVLTKRSYVYERNRSWENLATVRTECKRVHGVEVIFALDHTLFDVNEKLYLPERIRHMILPRHLCNVVKLAPVIRYDVETIRKMVIKYKKLIEFNREDRPLLYPVEGRKSHKHDPVDRHRYPPLPGAWTKFGIATSSSSSAWRWSRTASGT